MQRDDRNAEAVIRIRDSGVGISADMLQHVFEPFMQAARTPAGGQSGLGIGLTLVHRLIELHGGSVEAHSSGIGRGSEFVLRVPITGAADRTRSDSAAADAEVAVTARRVLVVDDNIDSAESLCELLRLTGHDVQVANDGEQALAIAAEYLPEVVVLDVGLPGMSGHEVARRLRQLAQLQDCVLVALTGFGTSADRMMSQAAGFDHHITKPADLDVLQALVAGAPARRNTGR
jgi:CheY-like chemotaxis protein